MHLYGSIAPIALILFISNIGFGQMKYPQTRKTDQEDNYFGTIVKDPFRWLEDDSPETKKWIKEENQVTEAYLSTIPYRQKIRDELKEIWNYPKYGAPFRRGGYYYFYKNDGLQNQAVLYRQQSLDGASEVFLDPNRLSKEGTSAVSAVAFSKDNRYVAYLVAQAGSDWQRAQIMRVENKQLLTDDVRFIKFSNISWDDQDGFYYSRYPVPDKNNGLTDKNIHHAVYYHKTGSSQTEDALIFEDRDHPYRTVSASVTEDKRYLLIHVSEGTSGSELWAKDLKSSNGKFVRIITGFDTESSFVTNDGKRLLVLTNRKAANYRLVSIDPESPGEKNWETIIDERKQLLEGVGTAGGKLFLSYLKDASSRIYSADFDGTNVTEIVLPGLGTATGFDGKKEDKELFFTFTSFSDPASIFKLNIRTGVSELFRSSGLKLNTSELETRQVFFASKDGTKVPMFLTSKKGIELNGQNPVLLYGYGGFNIPMTPAFSLSNAYFIEKGGVYAVVNLRGGSEYGEKWHEGGMLLNKQNVFDDMIAGAEYLIKENYTRPEKLAVRGGSNGGLLVGAVMTQRPDLFNVAIPQVGVMDMLRYHLFTIGWAWATEYGRSDDEKSFRNLYRYSPLHNLKKGVSYPATLITTADHDDRVVPAHSFKFAATLQECNSGPNPVLIRIDTQAGHGAGKPTEKVIDEAADVWSFVMYHLGMTP